MSRLRHSERALVRVLQMSRCDLFAFVEGWSDRYFYDRVCQFALRDTPFTFQVRTSAETSGLGDGKEALLKFFLYLRRRKLLFSEFKGKKTAVIFFLDKDVDDYLRILKPSDHVVYTPYYSVENHYVRHSDLVDVVACAGALNLEAVEDIIGDEKEWTRRAADEWKDWMKLCLLTRIIGTNSPTNYGRTSQLNVGAYGGVIPGAVVTATAEILAASGLPMPDFARVLAKASRFVDQAFRHGHYDRLFKGKWYGVFVAEDARNAAAGRQYDGNAIGDRVFAIAASKRDFAQPWSTPFVAPVRRIFEKF